MNVSLTGVIVVWVICGIVGALIGPDRGYASTTGFMIGLLLGVFGLVLIVLARGGSPTPAEIEQRRQWEQWQYQQQYQQWQYQQWRAQQQWQAQPLASQPMPGPDEPRER